ILGLHRPNAGQITVRGKNICRADAKTLNRLQRNWGVLYQHGALFSGLTVLENIALPIHEYLNLPDAMERELALVKLRLVGLKDEAAYKFPAELSGGMVKRAALARALALDPPILFL